MTSLPSSSFENSGENSGEDSGSAGRLDRLDLDFPHGLPGFETSRRFVLQLQTALAPIATLQSAEQTADLSPVCFLVVPVALLVKDYALLVTLEDLRTLGLEEDRQPQVPAPGTLSNVLCLAILTVPKDGAITANLLAPVVVNLATRVAVQAVRADTAYSHRHPIASLHASSLEKGSSSPGAEAATAPEEASC